MTLVQVPLDGGGSILIRASDESGGGDPAGLTSSGPVRAGRIHDQVEGVVTEAAQSLRDALEPLTQMSRQVLDQFAESSPQEVQVEFGVELTAAAGAVLTRAGAGCHFTVTLTWKQSDHPPTGA